MSDVSQGPGWWQASDGKWYPPADTDQPAPGWWLASDGNWYPPEQRTTAPTETAALDPSGRTPVKPVAKPVKGTSTAAARPNTAAMGTPAGPAVAPPTPAAKAGRSPAPPIAPPTSAAPTGRAEAAPPSAPASPAPSAPPAAKPAAAAPKGPNAAPASAPTGRSGPTPADPGPSLAAALSPDEQIRARNEQSRRDAAVLFGARKSAATRALGNISALLDDAKAEAPAPREPEPTRRPAAAAPTGKTAASTGRVAKADWSNDAADPGAATGPRNRPTMQIDFDEIAAAAASAKGAPAPAGPVAPTPPVEAPSESPLLEVKQGTLAADIEHIGERLVIFNDRVELHDRSDRVRQVIAGSDIADVVVHKKFTGSTVTVEAGTGERIVAKGLKPDQADEIRAVILKRTRAGAPGAPPAAPTRPETAATVRAARDTGDATIVDARDTASERSDTDRRADLLAKLDDLHRAGVLTDAELAEKQALVDRIVNGEPFAVSTPSA